MPTEMDINVNFNVGGVAAGAAGAGRAPTGGGVLSAAGIGGAIGGAIGATIAPMMLSALEGILDIMKEVSPALKGTFRLFESSMILFLQPIADIMANFLKPMALALIPYARKFNEWMYGGGMLRIETFLRGMSEILTGILYNLKATLTFATAVSPLGPIFGVGLADVAKDFEQSGIYMSSGLFRIGEAATGTVETLEKIKAYDATELVSTFTLIDSSGHNMIASFEKFTKSIEEGKDNVVSSISNFVSGIASGTEDFVTTTDSKITDFAKGMDESILNVTRTLDTKVVDVGTGLKGLVDTALQGAIDFGSSLGSVVKTVAGYGGEEGKAGTSLKDFVDIVKTKATNWGVGIGSFVKNIGTGATNFINKITGKTTDVGTSMTGFTGIIDTGKTDVSSKFNEFTAAIGGDITTGSEKVNAKFEDLGDAFRLGIEVMRAKFSELAGIGVPETAIITESRATTPPDPTYGKTWGPGSGYKEWLTP